MNQWASDTIQGVLGTQSTPPSRQILIDRKIQDTPHVWRRGLKFANSYKRVGKKGWGFPFFFSPLLLRFSEMESNIDPPFISCNDEKCSTRFKYLDSVIHTKVRNAPDPRDHLANERNLLTWLRTGVTLTLIGTLRRTKKRPERLN
jgi:hypothetical protein